MESHVLGDVYAAAGEDRCRYRRRIGEWSRTLGVPTVADRVAQTVVKLYLEPAVEPLFHPDSYGYRPGPLGARRGEDLPGEVLADRTGSIQLDYTALLATPSTTSSS